MKVYVVLYTSRFVEVDSVHTTRKGASLRVKELEASDVPPYDIAIQTHELVS